MDALTSILRSMRLRSAMLSRARLRGRFGVHSRGIGGMLLHGVVEGRVVVTRDAAPGEPLELEASDVVILTRGEAHVLGHEAGAAATPIATLPFRASGAVLTLEQGAGAPETRIVCGRIDLDHPAATSMVRLLPPVIVARACEGSRRRWLDATLALLDEEVQAEDGAGRAHSLVEALFAHALGVTQDATPGVQPSLLAAARDEQIGKALALVHAEPGGEWSAQTLAAKVGLSRTRFFDRFSDLVGEPPARYVARWRVHAAADMMRQSELSTAEIAEKVGYSSEDALAKVFRRVVGVTPTQWRRANAARED